jgi:hypothetical protein
MFTHFIDELKAIRNTSTPTLPQIEASVTNAMTSAFQTSMATALTSAFTQFHQLLRNDSVNIPTTTIQRVISPQHESTMHIQSPQNIGMTSTSICGANEPHSDCTQYNVTFLFYLTYCVLLNALCMFFFILTLT